MIKRRSYDSIFDRYSQYLQDYFLMCKNKNDRDAGGRPTKEYNRLVQAKKRLLDSIDEGFEGALLFNDLMYVGKIKLRSRQQLGVYNKVEKNPKLDRLKLYFDDEADKEIPDEFKHKVNDKLNSLQVEVVQEIFTEKRMERLFDALFSFNFDHHKDILTEDQFDYYANVAALMVLRGISELKKYIDPQYASLLFHDLDRVEQICRIVRRQKEKKIHGVF